MQLPGRLGLLFVVREAFLCPEPPIHPPINMKIAPFLLTFSSILSLHAAPLDPIPLWPGGAPGALGTADQDIPTLTAYLPAPEKTTGAAIVICPGGGYGGLAAHEGAGYAEWLAENGVAGIVLKYRLGSNGYRHPAMLNDAARAVRLTRSKATEWKIRCGNSRIPVLFLQGSPGYMVGKNEEWGGIGKYGADMVRACSCLEVPKVTYVIGPDHGAANYGMCGRAFKPRFAFTNMRGRTTVMSGETAGFILETVRRKNITDRGGAVDEAEMARFRQAMRERYDEEGHPFYTGSLLFHDGVIAFAEARDKLARAFEISLRVPVRESIWGDLKV